MNNASTSMFLPPLPSFTLEPRAPLLAPIPDAYLSLLAPIVAYWGFSMVFHYIDEFDLFPQYRLHTPAEVLKRNHVSRWEVVRDVVLQQIIQTIVGIGLAMAEPEEYVGKDDYNVAVWAQRLRMVQRFVPKLLAVTGVDAKALGERVVMRSPSLAAVLAGGQYPWLMKMTGEMPTPGFASWEMSVAKAIYWFVIPAIQFGLAILIVDTWQYFLHRAMHMNKWLYTTFHSRHHRLYVPYAYGALYNHPFEGFLLDTCGAGLAYLLTGMTPLQGMCFFTGSTIKTVDDHCGYALPWDPLQRMTSNNAGYHDVHHQSWGIKTNFSQPFFTFWDRLLGTAWVGGDVSARYERARVAAERKVNQKDTETNPAAPITSSNPLDSLLSPTNAPYTSDLANATTQTSITHTLASPKIPRGKATAQAIGSREQVLQDRSPAGGANVIAEETAEEEREVKMLKRSSPRKRAEGATTVAAAAASASASSGGLKGLRERVAAGSVAGGSVVGFHGRTGGVLGYESSR